MLIDLSKPKVGTKRVINKALDTPHHIFIAVYFRKYDKFLEQIKIIQFHAASNPN